MLILRSIQLGIRANFSRRWDTVVLTVQPVITFYLRITVIIATPGVGGGGSAQSQIENKGCDISFSGTTRHDNGDWLTNYFRISDERVSAFCQKYQVELAPTEEIRDIVILRLFDRLYVAPPNGRPQQRLGRKSQNPSGRFQGAEGFHALATEIDASVTPDPEYMLKNKTTTLTQLYYTGTIRKTIDDLTYALHLRYDCSLALRSNVTRSPSEELGEMTLQEVPERATR